ncbi:MAG: ABC transporter substrate-binding protein [Desulfobacteraceae bacterium]|jgi:ABC-type branched-subunit amino acid transport system substrate-binding protein|nr:MAG: ABC transporter substrate-binding protein [Desulfobacteraceae bacterium]
MERNALNRRGAVLTFGALIAGLCLFCGYGVNNLSAKEVVVKVGVTSDQTGPLTIEGRKSLTAWKWYEEYINEEQGGWKDVAGNTVKLKVLHGDTGFKPGNTLSLYKKFKADGVVAITQVGSVELAAVRSAALKDKMPLPTNSGALIYPLPSPCTAHWPDYSACSAAAIDYVKEKWEKSDAPWTKNRAPKLAFVGPEAYPSWEACITPEVMRYAKLHGVDVVGTFFVPIHPIDTKPQVMSAVEKKANFVYTGVVVSQGGAIVRDVYELGLKGDPTKNEDKLEVIGLFPMSALEMIKVAGGRPEAVSGMRIIGSHAYVWEGGHQLQIIRKCAEKHGETQLLDHNYVHGWYAAIRTGEAIRLALQKVPGDKLTRSDVWDAFLEIKDFDTGGIVPSKITFDEENRIGMKKVRVDEVVGKKGRRELVTYTDYKMLAPIYTEEYAKAHGKKSIYSDEALDLLDLKAEDVGYKRIKE